MAETGTQQTIIGSDTHIKGDMTFDGTAKILGTFEGKITAKGDLHVADGATCRAVVEAGKVTVDGVVDGNVTARERIELTGKAKMKGDLVAARLLVPEAGKAGGSTTYTGAAMAEAKPNQQQAAGQAKR
jgi:cytoskeletal protein CcmA (bactofilin family)